MSWAAATRLRSGWLIHRPRDQPTAVPMISASSAAPLSVSHRVRVRSPRLVESRVRMMVPTVLPRSPTAAVTTMWPSSSGIDRPVWTAAMAVAVGCWAVVATTVPVRSSTATRSLAAAAVVRRRGSAAGEAWSLSCSSARLARLWAAARVESVRSRCCWAVTISPSGTMIAAITTARTARKLTRIRRVILCGRRGRRGGTRVRTRFRPAWGCRACGAARRCVRRGPCAGRTSARPRPGRRSPRG